MKHHIPYRDNPHLSKREKEVLSLLLEGQSEKQIALRLQI
ncbi:MAG: hypothetical protein JWM57_3249, partial [Phycisphaerales bacterium]|nr:hypothetical protein [Phycisphaerales bacterium]